MTNTERRTPLTNAQLLQFWKNMTLGLKDEMVARGNRIAELEAQLAEARKWMPSTSYSTGVLTIGERLYVEIRDWGGADEDAAWNHLQDEAGATQ